MRIPGQIFSHRFAFGWALVIAAFQTHAQNILVNPGFEDPLLSNPGVNEGWAAFGGAERNDMLLSPDYAHSGDYSLLAQNAPGNNWNPVGVEQVVNGAMPGITYEFECWYLTDTGVTLAAQMPPVALEIEFLDSAMVNLGVTGGFNYVIPSNDTWYQGSVIATAPAGSVYVKVLAMFMDNGQTAAEHVYFDDASIPLIPEPSGLALVGMGLGVLFCFRNGRNI